MPKTKKLKTKLTIFILSIVAIIFGWGLVVPAFEFPDEQAHFGTVTFLTDKNRLPTYKEKDVTREMYQTQELLGILRDDKGNNQYTYHPEHTVEYSDFKTGLHEQEIINLNTPQDRNTYTKDEAARYPALYYSFSSFFLNLVNNKDIITRLFTTRIGSLFIAAAMALTVFKTGMLLFGKKSLALTLTTITMLQPMMSFVTAGINSDNLHNLLFMLIILFSLKVVKIGTNLTNLLTLSLLVVADIYTKPQGLLAIPIILTALVISIIKKRRLKQLVYIALAAIASFIALVKLSNYQGFLAISNLNGESFLEFLSFSANKLITQNVVWYWGVFKWLGVVLPPIYWQLANRVVLVSGVGILVYFYKLLKKKKVIIDPFLAIFLILTTLIYTTIIFWLDWQYLKGWGFSIGVQARYFFPTIVAHMALIQVGLLSLSWNKTSKTWIKRGLVLLFFWLQLGGIWTIIKSYYNTSSLQLLITQMSQYKPIYAKGQWWYLWGAIYLLGLIYLLRTSLKNRD